MKKIIFAMTAFCLIFASCSNSKNEAEPKMVEISFVQEMVSQGNSMAKSEGPTGISPYVETIRKHTPSVVIVTLKNIELNKEYRIESNKTIKVPVGAYEISAVSSTTGMSITGGYVLETPSITCDKFSMNITGKTTQVTLNMYYNCYAVFALKSECNELEGNLRNEPNSFVSIVKNKDNTFLVGYLKDNSIIRIIPKEYGSEHNRVVVNFVLQTTRAYETTKCARAEYGKYYILRPVAVDKTETSFDILIEDMEQGYF